MSPRLLCNQLQCSSSLPGLQKPLASPEQATLAFAPTQWLDGLHTIFGEVIEGQDVLDKITRREPDAGVAMPPE